MQFLQKRWVRVIGLIPMTIYTLLACFSVYAVLANSVFRPPNQVFAMTDLIGWIGLFFFLMVIAMSGVLAILTAKFMAGVFRTLYVAGALVILSTLMFVPLSFAFTADVEFHPPIPNEQFLVGTWLDDSARLELAEDHTYTLETAIGPIWSREHTKDQGEWWLEGNKLHLAEVTGRWPSPWEVTQSEGYYFITYSIPANFDAWSGDLGLMRETDWLAAR